MKPLRVLIVDDEEELVSALGERLNLRGFQAAWATTGADALAYLQGTPCDVVVLDVKMPGLSGLELMMRIKAEHPRLQVILLTGHSSTHDAERGMQLGAFDYLMKPVKIDELVRVLQTAAARKASDEVSGA